MPARRRLLPAAVAAGLLVPAAQAAAAPPPFGGLTQIACVSEDGSGGCARVAGLAGVSAVTVSSAGHVYAVSPVSSTVVALRARTLEPIACMSAQPRPGCVVGRALGGATDLAIGGDRELYVAARDDDAVAVLRIGEDGGLTQPPGPAGCLAMTLPDCGRATALDEPVALGSVAGRIYVAARGSDAVAGVGGSPPIQAGCTMQDAAAAAAAGCTAGRALLDPSAIADTGYEGMEEPVVVASSGSDGLAFIRGASVVHCITEGGTEGCQSGQGLSGAASVALTHEYLWRTDQRVLDIYVAAPGSGGLTHLRSPGAGVLHQMGTVSGLGAVSEVAMPPEMSHPIADAPDYGGSHVYTGGTPAIGVFGRAYETGGLTALPTPALPWGAAVGQVAVTPDVSSAFAYAAVPGAGAVVAFSRQMRPACASWFSPPPIEVPSGATTRIEVPPCGDANGDPLTYAIETPPEHGRLGELAADRTVPYTPAPGYAGDDVFVVRASDGTETATKGVRLKVLPDRVAPRVRILDGVLRLDRRGRGRLRLRANEDCRVTLRLRRGGRALARATVALPAGRTRRVAVRLRRPSAGRAWVAVQARDAAGNARRATRRVRVRPR